jgi:opacity protein-like surface antigen
VTILRKGLFVFIFFLLSLNGYAASVEQPKYLKELGVLTGYGRTSVDDKDDYIAMPVHFRVGVDMDKMQLGYCDWVERGAKKFFNKDFHPQGYTEFVMEPFVSYVPQPDTNAEFGLVLLSKFAYPLTPKVHPYIFAGGGVMYITQHLREQSTQYNFTPQLGVGVSLFLKENMALDVEWRWRHFSNAMIKRPNDGVNLKMIFVGVSWFFE